MAAVAALATAGTATSEAAPLVSAGVLTLPSSLAAVPGFYLTYGFLTQLPRATGAGVSTGSGYCTGGGVCHESSSGGGTAVWLDWTAGFFGEPALAGAAVLNIVALYGLVSIARRNRAAARRGS